MHKYLKSIGFAAVNSKEELRKLLKDVENNYDQKVLVEKDDKTVYAQISKEYGEGYGISVFGEYDENNRFHREYYFPFYKGSQITTYEDMFVERHSDKQSFAGACDDVRVGASIIFYLLNVVDYMKMEQKDLLRDSKTSLNLSALVDKGKVLLPVCKTVKEEHEEKAQVQRRSSLIAAARNGDQEAIESLTMEDIDTFNMVTERLKQEDLYSIVSTFFMPHGIECDQYKIMGDITDCSFSINDATGEKIYRMSILCNDLPLDICVSEKDLLGMPAIGCRFKGTVWLQGNINF